MQAMKDQANKKGPNFTITRKDLAVRIVPTKKFEILKYIYRAIA